MRVQEVELAAWNAKSWGLQTLSLSMVDSNLKGVNTSNQAKKTIHLRGPTEPVRQTWKVGSWCHMSHLYTSERHRSHEVLGVSVERNSVKRDEASYSVMSYVISSQARNLT